MKRSLDLVLAILLAPLALVLCAICLVAIRLETPGSPIFLQTRVGRGKAPFTLVKLRTMRIGTEHRGSHEIGEAQVTRVGRVLRRLKLDELPQIANVLAGQMSFVGPRPCLPTQHELIAERERRGVFEARPGITGPAQLAGIDMSRPRALAEADAAYIRERSFTGDLSCIWRTALGGGRGDRVKAG